MIVVLVGMGCLAVFEFRFDCCIYLILCLVCCLWCCCFDFCWLFLCFDWFVRLLFRLCVNSIVSLVFIIVWCYYYDLIYGQRLAGV